MEDIDIEQIANAKILDFAKSQPPKIWHQMVMDWNWDNYKTFLTWLIENPKSDRATIAMIYWKSNPTDNFAHKEHIESNFSNGFYKNQQFSFVPENDEGDNWVSYVSEEAKTAIPEIMFRKLQGENIAYPEGFIEGMPEKLFFEIEDLNE